MGRPVSEFVVLVSLPPDRSVIQPPSTPITAAATTLKMANGNPKNEALTSTESTPVCGVLIRNATAEPSLAPSFFNPIPAGITPQEHSGKGTPMATDLITPQNPRRFLLAKPTGSRTCIKPAKNMPSSSHGDSSHIVFQIEATNSMVEVYRPPPECKRTTGNGFRRCRSRTVSPARTVSPRNHLRR